MMRFHFVFIFFLCGLSVIKEQFTYIKKKKKKKKGTVHLLTMLTMFILQLLQVFLVLGSSIGSLLSFW